MFQYCTLDGNRTGGWSSPGKGAGIYARSGSARLQNCIIKSNVATQGDYWQNGYGGGLYSDGSELKIVNCTLVANVADPYSGYSARGGGIYSRESSVTLTDCILWSNTPDALSSLYGEDLVVIYSNVQGGWDGMGNIDAFPRLRSFKGFDYILWPGSPCIDAGGGGVDGVDWGTIHSRYGDFNTALADMGADGGPGNVGWLP